LNVEWSIRAPSSGVGSGIHAGANSLGWGQQATNVAMVCGGAISGGFGASISGGDFWHGFGAAATTGLMNHVLHNRGGTDPLVEDDSGLFNAAEKFSRGEISREQYLNAVTLHNDGVLPLVGQVLWNNKFDIGLAFIPGGRIIGRVIQRGGQTITKRTLRTLGLSRQQARTGVESLKQANGLPPNFHGRITENGYYLHPNRNINYGRIYDYLP